MRPHLADAVLESLGFVGDSIQLNRVFEDFSRRDWERTLAWMDDAGLALYFLQEVRNSRATGEIPSWVLAGLEQRLTANQARLEDMALQFRLLNQKFEQAHVNYAVVKGFSLVPQFCPDACLRNQSDLDYLVDAESFPRAAQVLEQSGYYLGSSTNKEFKFLGLSTRTPSRQEQYNAFGPYAVELHLALWDGDLHGVLLSETPSTLAGTKTREWQGSHFRALADEEEFLLQVIHAFHHILTYWIRLSSLYEIAYFLHRRADDEFFWTNLEVRLGTDAVLRELTVLIVKLAADFFRAPLPRTIVTWSQELRLPVRVWIQKYARTWAFGNQCFEFSTLPTAKLALFLHQQYVSDTTRLMRARLFPLTRLSGIAVSIKRKGTVPPAGQWRNRKRTLRLTYFHLAANLRYLWERPRWRRLNDMAQQASLE